MNLPSRWFWWCLILLLPAGCRPGAETPGPAGMPTAAAADPGGRQYAVRLELTISNEGPGRPEKQNIWVALIRDLAPYQTVQSMDIAPAAYRPVVDEYGNAYAEFDFSGQPAATVRTIRIDYRVTVNELRYDLSDCSGDLPQEFTRPELHIESANPQIASLAGELARGKTTACGKVRAFYDYVADHLTYTRNNGNWGAQAALGPMGADCTEYTDLLVALSRAEGIPARYFEGLRYLEPGTSGDVEHAWPDVYLPSVGWTALDPTLGRTPARREEYFAHYTPDHVIVTLGANPSVLRGGSYWAHLYWPGNAAVITVSGTWTIDAVAEGSDPQSR
jgi:transglutaminase-like putative cysteine protease